jgi:hypothetical protein
MEKIFDTEKKLNKFGIVLGYEKEYCSEDCKGWVDEITNTMARCSVFNSDLEWEDVPVNKKGDHTVRLWHRCSECKMEVR